MKSAAIQRVSSSLLGERHILQTGNLENPTGLYYYVML